LDAAITGQRSRRVGTELCHRLAESAALASVLGYDQETGRSRGRRLRRLLKL